ncbi:MAG: Lar family restriction alleviation protein [Eubacteriales bacterium]|nr:Lar family restriction alleviation protein [Eubacteriales bacterium]
MPELKPCPFCGGEAIISTSSHDSSHYCVGFVFGIECTECGIQLPGRFKVEFSLRDDGEINILNDERQTAAGLWNRRAKNETD